MSSAPSNHDQLQEIFLKAVELASVKERAAFLEDACGDDVDLRHHVDSLIEDHEQENSATRLGHERADLKVMLGTVIGRYKLLEKIGEGGFGTVYLANQTEPVVRHVALKIIKLGMDSKEVIARFEAERQALALMDDPNIAKVLDAGATESGRPYFVMELVKGIPITKFCSERRLNTRERLAIFLNVCSAVQHAHQKGIIHRDLKPSNVMVALHGDRPVPKVIDFGIAKATHQQLTDKTLFTRFEQLIGTPVYMSPEQAALSGLDIDTRSDIYALGILLYELLTGKPPFDAESLMSAGYDEMRRIIREVEPPKPSSRLSTMGTEERTTVAREHHADPDKLGRLMRGDLDWIVMKAIEKDRTRRYETANGFAMDIRRYLNDEPVVARAPSTGYRLSKFVRRNKASLSVVTAVFGALAFGLVAALWGLTEANEQRHIAQKERDGANAAYHLAEEQRLKADAATKEAERLHELAENRAESLRRRLYFSSVSRAVEAFQENRMHAMRGILDACPEDLRHWEWARLNRMVTTTDEISVAGSEVPLFTPDGKHVISLGDSKNQGAVNVWDVVNGNLVRILDRHESLLLSNALSRDGARLVAGDDHGSIFQWDVTSGRIISTIPNAHATRLDGIAFSPDGKTIASVSWYDFKVWNAETGELRFAKSQGLIFRGVMFSPTGDRILTAVPAWMAAGREGTEWARVWNAMTGEELLAIGSQSGHTSAAAYSPDGRWIATGSTNGEIALWDSVTGEIVRSRTCHEGVIQTIAFSPNGQLIAAGGDDSFVSVRDVGLDREVARVGGHQNGVTWLSFSPDGRRIASFAVLGGIRIWEHEKCRPNVITIPVHVSAVVYSPDGRNIASIDSHKHARCWDAHTGDELPVESQLTGSTLNYLPNGDLIIADDQDGTVALSDPFRAQTRQRLQVHEGTLSLFAFSPDGTRVATSALDSKVRLWSMEKGRLLRTFAFEPGDEAFVSQAVAAGSWPRRVVYSPDGTMIAGSLFGRLQVWSSATGDRLRSIELDAGIVAEVAFSPDSRLLAVVGDTLTKTIDLWDIAKGECLHRLSGHQEQINSVAFSPDGQRLFSASSDRTLKVWSLDVEQEVLTLEGHGNAVTCIAVSPDGQAIASASEDGSIKIWSTDLISP